MGDGGITLLGLSGSLRRRSTNTALLRAGQALVPVGVRLVIHPLRAVPFYDGDVERQGLPPAVTELRAAIAAADGLVLASPEYNHSVPAVLKNAFDWASRAPEPPVNHKPCLLLSAAGGSGGARAQRHWRDILTHNQLDVLDESLQVARAFHHFDDSGELRTPELRAELAHLLGLLTARIEARRGSLPTG